MWHITVTKFMKYIKWKFLYIEVIMKIFWMHLHGTGTVQISDWKDEPLMNSRCESPDQFRILKKLEKCKVKIDINVCL